MQKFQNIGFAGLFDSGRSLRIVWGAPGPYETEEGDKTIYIAPGQCKLFVSPQEKVVNIHNIPLKGDGCLGIFLNLQNYINVFTLYFFFKHCSA